MIVCKDCGHQNANGTTFCDSCGTFLEWGGESVLTGAHQAIPSPDAPPTDPAAPPETPAAPQSPAAPASPEGGAFQAQRLPVISDPAAPAETPIQGTLGGAAQAPPPPPPPAQPAAQQPAAAPPADDKAPGAARPGTQVLRALRMKARPPAPPAPPQGPTARAPAEEQARRPPRPPSAEAARPQANAGDVFCSACGTPNDPARNYCRSCGSPLGGAAPVAAAVRVSWWRRVLGRGSQPAGEPVPAGTRNRAGGGKGGGRRAAGAGQGVINTGAHLLRRFFSILAILGALGVGVVEIGPWRSDVNSWVRGKANDVRSIISPTYTKVTPAHITASTSLKANPPENAFDGIIETFWAEGAHGDGAGQSLTATFDKPVDLSRIGLTLGDQASVDKFPTHPMPKTLELQFYDKNGSLIKAETLQVAQTAKFQRKDASASGVAKVVITIKSTYPPEKGTKSSAAIAEVELYKKN